MRQFVAIDAEGDVGERGLLGCAFYSEHVRVFHADHRDIHAELMEFARAGYTFLAHNANYELPVLFWQLGLSASAHYFGGTFNHGEWRYSRGRRPAHIWDTLDLSGGLSIEALGQALGIPKYPSPLHHHETTASDPLFLCPAHLVANCIECYALRDAEICYRYAESLFAQVALWSVPPGRRLGSLATGVWKALDSPAPIKLRDGRIRHLARRAHYGGRVETLKLGHFAPLYGADITSTYAAAMLSTPMPDPAHMVFAKFPSVDAVPWHQQGVAECTVQVPFSYLPPLPNTRDGLRVFGVGRQRGAWTFEELRYARLCGVTIEKVSRAAWSTQSLFPFQRFITTLWDLRCAYKLAGDPRELVAKRLMNTLYGRLGLASHVKEEVIRLLDNGEAPSRARGDEPFVQAGAMFVRYEREVPFEWQWINELWAATITAAARVKLHTYLVLQGENVVYCDTDSVFSMAPIVGLGEGLGELSRETRYREAWIAGPKLYRLERDNGETETYARGIPKDRAEAFISGAEVVFEQPWTPREMAQGKGIAGQWHRVAKSGQLLPARRQPLDPEAMLAPYGWSDTSPPVFLPHDLG